MRIEEEVKLDFSDVLLRPKRSLVASRQDIDLTREYRIGGNPTDCGIPIIASNFDTVGTFAMAQAMSQMNMWTCLHKHYTVEQLVVFFSQASDSIWERTFYTMGVSDEEFTKLETVFDKLPRKPKFVCVDVANGYGDRFVKRVAELKAYLPSGNCVMAGNVVTPDMVQELIIGAKVDIVKVGIGSGSVCTTRKKTGVGYPQLSAVIECADAAHGLNALVCSDGGCVLPGDVVKAFAGGSDFVMLGGMLAGTEECDGQWEEDYDPVRMIHYKKALRFYGMSSKNAMEKHCGGVASYKTEEGKLAIIPYKGPVSEVAQDILGGLRSACTYVGAGRLKDLSKCTTFIKVNRVANECFS